ncbi:MAG: hypothetical protein CMJ93_02590 [Planctomycetes bacterium]|nr:hypothetical protein [Planctomycetota bacterium]
MALVTEAIGLAAACCTTLAFIPQAIQIIRTRDTRSLSLGMYACFTIGVGLWLTYGCLLGNRPIIIANSITFGLATLILALKLRYR